ncbi:alpha-hydroxy acid oxidase [Ramlibacter sp. Leaf400]|uniref:alpha-hydroxy acid oxidase n=1 Tax=Ramlibacter sp. Leaf400 TaxID=1736365 RepID=UPI000A7C2AEC|nr:alpha-hydroxy acid oxidase [Ramlibacter sp. Leaf400]
MQGIHNIEDLRLRARGVLPRGLFEFVDRGTEDEQAIPRIQQALEQIALRPRVLVDVSACSTQRTFFGKPSRLPFAVAPTGAAGLLWVDGEVAVARAAAKAGVPFTLSTASIVSMERVAAEAGGRLWFQLYMWPDRSMSYELVDRARASGYEALMVTVDTAVTPNREYNLRNGFSLPLKITSQNALDVALHPGWFFNVFARYLLRSGVPRFENYPEKLRRSLADAPAGRRMPKNDSLTWDDLRELRKRWDGPLILKGILTPEDADMARRCGADAVVVSNHGGRNLDASIPPIEVLPQVVDRVGRNMEVYVDSGFRRGGDIVKALALGARGVLVGRAPLWGVAAAGEAGAARALQILTEETTRVLGLLGCPDVDRLSSEFLRVAGTPVPAAAPAPAPLASHGAPSRSLLQESS